MRKLTERDVRNTAKTLLEIVMEEMVNPESSLVSEKSAAYCTSLLTKAAVKAGIS
jgi:hypothetical protein